MSKKMELSKSGKAFQHHCAKKSLTGQWLWKATLFSILLSKKKALCCTESSSLSFLSEGEKAVPLKDFSLPEPLLSLS